MRAWVAWTVVLGACGDAERAGPEVVDGEVSGEVTGDVGPEAGDGADAEGADPYLIGASVPRASLNDALGRARCAFDARCEVGFAGTPAAECIAQAGTYAWFSEALERMYLEGKTYDPTAMAECLSALVARPCDEVGARNDTPYRDDGTHYFTRIDTLDWYRLPACRAALLQDGAPGAACYTNVECASGRCSALDDRSCGECLGVGATDTCTTFEDCAYDHVCDLATNTCAPRGERGAACRQDRECRTGLFCDGHDYTTNTLGTCTGLGAAGRSCDSYNFGAAPCPLGTRCSGDTCVAVPALLGDVGEACAEGPCRPGLTCFHDDDGATCRARGEGDACSQDNPRVSPLSRTDGCPLDLVCNEAKVCAKPIATGATCRTSRDCAITDFCERTTRQCTPRRGEGEVCSAYPYGQECAYPYTCVGSRLFGTDDGTCGIGADPGERCSGKEDCGPDVECSSEGNCYAMAFTYFGCH